MQSDELSSANVVPTAGGMASARLRVFGVALAIAAGLLVAGRQITPSRLYSANPAYRAQVDALLSGRFAISHSPTALRHDFAWVNGGVQQVWGLGVPLWQAPFELAARAVGRSPFPDRIALLLWLALSFYVLIRGVRRDGDSWWITAGSVLVTALLPAIVTLVRGRFGVYEEAAIYAYGAELILLGTTLRVVAAPCRWRYLGLLAFAGASGFIRPTVWCWGVASAIVATVAWLRAGGRHRIAVAVLGASLFVAGGAALYATNQARFGSGFEFGHRLNLQSLPGNMYGSRFSYPMKRASLGTAALELATSFFDRPELRKHKVSRFYEPNLHRGVAAIVRWREYYFTTFSWWYVPVLLAGLVLGAAAWRRRAGPPGKQRQDDRFARAAFAWAMIGAAPLLAYYLRSSIVSSRYQLDVAPAFTVLLLLAWRAAAQRYPRAGFAVLAVVWFACVFTAKTARPRNAEPVGRSTAALAAYELSRAPVVPVVLPAAYDLADPWAATYTDVVPTFARCRDLDGAAIDAEAAGIAGDRCVLGEHEHDDEQWLVAETRVAGLDEANHTCPATDDDPASEAAPSVCEPAPITCAPDASAMTGDVTVTYLPPPALYLNIFGWDLATGQVPPATHVYVEDPEFIEVDVSTLDGKPADWSREVQVAIGRQHLHLVSIADAGDAVRLRFEGAHLPRGLQVAFFAFGPDTTLGEPHSRFALRRIAWR